MPETLSPAFRPGAPAVELVHVGAGKAREVGRDHDKLGLVMTGSGHGV